MLFRAVDPWCVYQPGAVDAARGRFAPQVAHNLRRALRQPQNARGDGAQQLHPYVEDLGRDLVV